MSQIRPHASSASKPEYAQEEAGEYGLHSQYEKKSGRNDHSHSMGVVQKTEMLGPPDAYCVDRSAQAKDNQYCPNQESDLKSDVAEKPVQGRIGRKEALRDREQLSEDSKSDSLKSEEDECSCIKERVDIECNLAYLSWRWQQP